eukprot:1181447-Prorocentrum_minimum.AAC.1
MDPTPEQRAALVQEARTRSAMLLETFSPPPFPDDAPPVQLWNILTSHSANGPLALPPVGSIDAVDLHHLAIGRKLLLESGVLLNDARRDNLQVLHDNLLVAPIIDPTDADHGNLPCVYLKAHGALAWVFINDEVTGLPAQRALRRIGPGWGGLYAGQAGSLHQRWLAQYPPGYVQETTNQLL